MTSVRIICPNLKCRCILSVPSAARGKTIKCRQCGMRVQVPGKRPNPVTVTEDEPGQSEGADADAGS